MTEEVKDRIIQDALKKKFLIEVCSACSYPVNEDDLIFFKMMDENSTHDCAASTMLVWNSLLEIRFRD